VVETKLVPPGVRDGTIARRDLVDCVTGARAPPVVGVFAPAGYGKTTLLAQSMADEQRPVAWVSLDEGDNDPAVLLLHIAAAIDRVSPLDTAFLASLASPLASEPSGVHLLCAELSGSPQHVLVLDDTHLVSGPLSRDILAALALHVRPNSQMVLSGRSSDNLPITRLRGEGQLLEIGAADLALDDVETRAVLEHAGVSVSAEDAVLLQRHTEGWAIGIYLAALSIGTHGSMDDALAAFSGEDRYVVDYVRSEFLDKLPAEDVHFLTATAVLERLCGPLCDAVLKSSGSALKLEALERSNLNVVPLDRTREWYRYHHLFRDALRSELQHREPAMVPALHRRAADWLEAHGEPSAAVEHALAADDVERAARLISTLAIGLERTGRGATVARWLDTLGPEPLERVPSLALVAGWFTAFRGDTAGAQRWLAATERGPDDGSPALGAASFVSAAAMLRALTCAAGVDRMRADAELAVDIEADWSPWRAVAVCELGFAHLLTGDDRRAEALFADVVREASRIDAPGPWSLALAQRSLYALERGELSEAEGLSREAREHAVLHTSGAITAFAFVASARVAQRAGDARRLADHVAAVQLRRPNLTPSIPWLSALTLLQLALVHVASGDSAGARTILRDVNDLLQERPDLGVVRGTAKKLLEQAQSLPLVSPGASTLTSAELRLLPLLPTHLRFKEIGARLFVSPNTVKSQAISIYRKLGVSSRGQAVARAREIGLLGDPVAGASGSELHT
jgi:LuxR family maltose regulon positive regulatory protein